ncbi:MAG: hypothetical protein P4M14_05580 [Gammaproteobacteria bacterium]|nr:hypothetical protein [Gammaproteobacteria bacterium]
MATFEGFGEFDCVEHTYSQLVASLNAEIANGNFGKAFELFDTLFESRDLCAELSPFLRFIRSEIARGNTAKVARLLDILKIADSSVDEERPFETYFDKINRDEFEPEHVLECLTIRKELGLEPTRQMIWAIERGLASKTDLGLVNGIGEQILRILPLEEVKKMCNSMFSDFSVNHHCYQVQAVERCVTLFKNCGLDVAPKLWSLGRNSYEISMVGPYRPPPPELIETFCAWDSITALTILCCDLSVLNGLDLTSVKSLTLIKCFGKKIFTVPPHVIELQIIDAPITQIICDHPLTKLHLEKVLVADIPKMSKTHEYTKVTLYGCDNIVELGEIENLNEFYFNLKNLEHIHSIKHVNSLRIHGYDNGDKLRIGEYSDISYVIYYDFVSLHFKNLVVNVTSRGHKSLCYLKEEAWASFCKDIKPFIKGDGRGKREYFYDHYPW